MLGGLAEPFDGFSGIERDASSVAIGGADVVLGNGVALFRRLQKPRERLRQIDRHTEADLVHLAEVALRIGETLVGSLPHPERRRRIAALDPGSREITDGELVLRCRISRIVPRLTRGAVRGRGADQQDHQSLHAPDHIRAAIGPRSRRTTRR